MGETNNERIDSLLSPGIIISVLLDVLKHWFLIAAAVLIAAMGAYVISDYFYTPQYQCKTTFVVNAGSATSTTFSNLTAAENTATVFSEVLNSSLLREKVVEQVGEDSTDCRVSASIIPGTNLLTMTVQGSNPRNTFLMSKAIIQYHSIVSEEALGNVILEVLRAPVVPSFPYNSPGTNTWVKRAALAAGAFVALLLAAQSYLADKIRSREEANNKLCGRILGELYHEKKRKQFKDYLDRKKKGILISDPLTSFLYTESVHKFSTRLDKCRHKGEHVIMVTSLMENEGKSTVAVNLALSLAKKGKKVLLIDADLRKPACSLILGTPTDTAGTMEVLTGRASMNDGIRHLNASGLYVLANRKIVKSATNLINSPAMASLLRQAAASFDMVVVDTPPMSAAPDAECIAEYADASVLVVRQNVAYANDINGATAILEQSKAHLLGYVLNNVYGGANFAPAFRYGGYGSYSKYGHYNKYGSYGRQHNSRHITKSGKEDQE